ncbi:hypothetical protein [Variovorax terrae]|uniref:Uncharacterized protein n=1 Tax=Variovorax terrae TaxID=2923278 RepID=A0A9X1W0X9_9BURK|nr:hypothetical protein [Variovorax terrae]MCJ0764093.1 hypothetical protein [Variovorax terrae]
MKGIIRKLAGIFATALSIGLAACGGGGGGASTPNATQSPVATLYEDNNPAGPTTDVRSLNLFPLAHGDQWIYAKLAANGNTFDTVIRSVAFDTSAPTGVREFAQPAATSNPSYVTVTETDGEGSNVTHYSKSSSGLTIVGLPDTSIPAAARNVIRTITEYPDVLYPEGSLRTIRREGSWGADLNGDGVPEGFRLTFTQIFRGFETLTFSGKNLSTAHFSNTLTLAIVSSNAAVPVAPPIIATEETYFASQFGMVQAVREAHDGNGKVITARHTLKLTSATVAGKLWSDHLNALRDQATTTFVVSLEHNAIVADPLRGVYYATVPAFAETGADSIATVNANSGTVSYTAKLNLNPRSIAISGDGSTLYVAGSGTLVRYRLPALTEVSRVTLPTDSFLGALDAESIAVSPVDASVVAVSLANRCCSPRHMGVLLYRNMVEQPVRTQTHTGSNVITFAPNGVELVGSNTETTESGLRRIAVLANGLQEVQVVRDAASVTMDVANGQVVTSSAAYASADLRLLGQLPGFHCRAAGSRILCLRLEAAGNYELSNLLVVVDPATLSEVSALRYGSSDLYTDVGQLTTGLPGRVAITSASRRSSSLSLTLFSSPSLP